jgi:uncharacterized hydrophobic protein (TIGR00271 family)
MVFQMVIVQFPRTIVAHTVHVVRENPSRGIQRRGSDMSCEQNEVSNQLTVKVKIHTQGEDGVSKASMIGSGSNSPAMHATTSPRTGLTSSPSAAVSPRNGVGSPSSANGMPPPPRPDQVPASGAVAAKGIGAQPPPTVVKPAFVSGRLSECAAGADNEDDSEDDGDTSSSTEEASTTKERDVDLGGSTESAGDPAGLRGNMHRSKVSDGSGSSSNKRVQFATRRPSLIGIREGAHGVFKRVRGMSVGSSSSLMSFGIGGGSDDPTPPTEQDLVMPEPGDAEEVDIEELVRNTLTVLQSEGYIQSTPSYHLTSGSRNMTVVFTCDAQHTTMIVGRLEHVGVGSDLGVVSVVPLEMCRSSQKGASAIKNSIRDTERFVAIASQIRVEQVIEEIFQSAAFTFDYACLLVVASLIAAVGLATNNAVIVVASMLVSPIMGPVLAFTFGSNVHDNELAMLGLRVELISLAGCFVTGFVSSLVGIPFLTDGQWPMPEMQARGEWYNLLIGIAIAVPSGVGVALSVLGNNTASLVGVAISASLLPPAVNCGLLCCYGWLGPYMNPSLTIDKGEILTLAGVSMLLTIENIVCIYFAGLFMFWVKEVAPIQNKSSFWSEDIIRSRKFHDEISALKTTKGDEAVNLAKRLQNAMRRASDAALHGTRPLEQLSLRDRTGDVDGDLAEDKPTHERNRGEQPNLPSVFDIFKLNQTSQLTQKEQDEILLSVEELLKDTTPRSHRKSNRMFRGSNWTGLRRRSVGSKGTESIAEEALRPLSEPRRHHTVSHISQLRQAAGEGEQTEADRRGSQDSAVAELFPL